MPFSPPGDLSAPGIEPRSPVLQADSLLSEPPGKPIRFQREGHKREGGKNERKSAPALKQFCLGLSPWEGSHVVERCSLSSGHLQTVSGMLPRRGGLILPGNWKRVWVSSAGSKRRAKRTPEEVWGHIWVWCLQWIPSLERQVDIGVKGCPVTLGIWGAEGASEFLSREMIRSTKHTKKVDWR